jgi:threonine/homoserine/homoserine lactone efflux protein
VIDTQNLIAFLAAAFLLNISPGPDMLYVLGRSVGQGKLAGYVSSLGIFTGCLVHVFAAAFGLAALLRTSNAAFEFIRWAGAAYMAYLGIRVLLQRSGPLVVEAKAGGELRSIFYQGVITNVLNPKVALFFLAFLPQFISPASSSPVKQTILLGLIFDCGGTIVNLGVAYSAASVGTLLQRNRFAADVQRWLTGVILLGLAARLALQSRKA